MSALKNSTAVTVFDPPAVLDCTVTPIPGSGSATLTVVASLPAWVHRVVADDGAGKRVGVYSGASGSEVLRFVVSGGSKFAQDVLIAPGSRISVRSMEAAAITTGSIFVQFEM